MVTNEFTLKTIKGVFSKIPIAIQKHREQKKEEKRLDNLRTYEEHKENKRYYNQSYIDEAREAQKEKARQIINSNAHLSKKIQAINELHRDHRQPKRNTTLQELSDKAVINRMKTQQRLEKAAMLKRVIQEDKENKQRERYEKLQLINEKNKQQKTLFKANLLIQQAKIGLRRV